MTIMNNDPLIFQRFLNHPEFVFPNRFIKPRAQIQATTTKLEVFNMEKRVKGLLALEE